MSQRTISAKSLEQNELQYFSVVIALICQFNPFYEAFGDTPKQNAGLVFFSRDGLDSNLCLRVNAGIPASIIDSGLLPTVIAV
eukprot:Awhi_evm1s1263